MRLYVAFKGIGNSSNRIVSSIEGDKVFLTNSFGGLKKDIDEIDLPYDEIYMFGLDKKLKGAVKIERCAKKDGVILYSQLDM